MSTKPLGFTAFRESSFDNGRQDIQGPSGIVAAEDTRDGDLTKPASGQDEDEGKWEDPDASRAKIVDTDEAGRVFRVNEAAVFEFKFLDNTALQFIEWVAVQDDESVEVVRELQVPGDIQTTKLLQPDGSIHQRFSLPTGGTESFLDKYMFAVLYEDPLSAGYASGVFTITTPENVNAAAESLESDIADNPTLEGGPTQENSPWRQAGDASVGPQPTVSTGDPSGPPGGPNSASPSGDSVASSGGGGLSIGAKAGIGAGVGVIGLILIGLAIFFLLRRRRRHAATAADETSLGPAGELIRDKETHAARVADSPASPGSDEDRGARDSAFLPADPPAAAQDTHASSPTPTSGQREAPTAMAHLVEDGMTEAELRRLEEEERALDQAIEQAGRR